MRPGYARELLRDHNVTLDVFVVSTWWETAFLRYVGVPTFIETDDPQTVTGALWPIVLAAIAVAAVARRMWRSWYIRKTAFRR